MRFRTASGLLALVLSMASTQAVASGFALLSTIGAHVSIVGERGATGTSVRTSQETVRVAERVLDATVLDVSETLLWRERPGSVVRRLTVDDAGWLDAVREASLDAPSRLPAPIEPVVAAARGAGVSTLVLFVPERADIKIRLKQKTIGAGRAAGLGWFVDPTMRVARSDDRAVGTGLLGAFANFRIVIVDTAGGQVVGDAHVATGRSYWGSRPSASPIDSLTAQEKLTALRTVVGYGIGEELVCRFSTAWVASAATYSPSQVIDVASISA